MLLTRYDLLIALTERIASVPFDTRAHGDVVEHCTLSIETARTWTRVFAPFSDTCLVTGTLGINRTLWPAIWWTATIV